MKEELDELMIELITRIVLRPDHLCNLNESQLKAGSEKEKSAAPKEKIDQHRMLNDFMDRHQQ